MTMEFTVILPSGQTININLKSKELKGRFFISQLFDTLKIVGDARKYFGLRYSDKDDEATTWLSLEDNLKSLSFLSTSSKRHPSMQLGIRIFPKNPELVFSTPESRMLFRQHIKNMMLSNELGCDSKTHAMLDAFIAQCELGDCQENDKEYIKKINKLNIYAPSLLGTGTPIGETEYMKFVRCYHKKLIGVRPAQADILFLSQVQKLPMYGYKIYNVSDKINHNYHLALSEEGIHFMYESYIETFTIPKRKETFAWNELVFSELLRNKVRLGFFIKNGDFVEHFIKVSGKYSTKGASRFLSDLQQYKDTFLNVVDGENIFQSRKKAQRVHSLKIPRKNTINKRVMHSLRSSLRSSLKINKKVRNASTSDTRNFSSYEAENRNGRINSE